MLGLSRRHHDEAVAAGNQRGRSAEKPSDMPASGWRDILIRVWHEQSKDNISIVAAGVTYYILLALFPALGAMVAIYGLVLDPGRIQDQFQALGGLLPPEAMKILTDQLQEIISTSARGLGFGALLALAIALWSASRGMNALITALNICYEETEKRSFIKVNAIALLLTVGAIIFLIVTLTLVVGIPAVLQAVHLPPKVEWTVSLVRWPIPAVAVMFTLAVLYRFAPSRDKPQWPG